MNERQLLQLSIAVACLIPIITGGLGVLHGIASLHGAPIPPPPDLDSHFRYLSGIFLALGLAFASTVPAIEKRGGRFRLLGAMVISGGLARGLSWIMVGTPSSGHRLGLIMELVIVPLLILWQVRVERRFA